MIFISCTDVRNELSNYFDFEIGSDLRFRIEEHFRTCDGCRAIYGGVRHVLRLVTEAGFIELPRDFSERLYLRLSGARAN